MIEFKDINKRFGDKVVLDGVSHVMETGKTNLIIGTSGYVASLDFDTGAELWRTKLQSGAFNATTREDVSVIVCEGKVFAGSQGHLICLDLECGTVIWHNELKGMGYNDVSLAIQNVSVQFLQKVERSSSNQAS